MTGKCSYCGKEDDLRPYGRNGAAICYDCGMLNETETMSNFKGLFDAALENGSGVLLSDIGPLPGGLN